MFLTNAKRAGARRQRETHEEECGDQRVTVSKFPSMVPDVSNSFEWAMLHLDTMMTTAHSKNKLKSIGGCKAVLQHMKRTSSVMAVKDLTTVYQQEVSEIVGGESSSKRMASSELQERFRDNGIEFVTFYLRGNAFAVFPKSENVDSILRQKTASCWCHR